LERVPSRLESLLIISKPKRAEGDLPEGANRPTHEIVRTPVDVGLQILGQLARGHRQHPLAQLVHLNTEFGRAIAQLI
jgi:hypothetical protein